MSKGAVHWAYPADKHTACGRRAVDVAGKTRALDEITCRDCLDNLIAAPEHYRVERAAIEMLDNFRKRGKAVWQKTNKGGRPATPPIEKIKARLAKIGRTSATMAVRIAEIERQHKQINARLAEMERRLNEKP